MAVDYKRMKESLKRDIKKRNSKFKPEDIAMKQEALREICEKEENTKEALAYNLDLRKTLNVILSDKGKLSPVQTENFVNKYWHTFLFAAPYDFHSFLLYMEKNRPLEKQFYRPRIRVLRPIVRDLQDLADGKLMRYGISMPPGVGKAQPLYCKVLTPTGFKKMGDVEIGDRIISGSGNECNVIGVFPQGVKDVYRIVFNDGTSTECCKEHIWHVQTRDDRRKSRFGKNGRYRNIQLQDMMKNLRVEHGKRKNYSIDYVSPVEFHHRDLMLHPYIVGALLGDGSLTSGNLDITSADPELVERLKSLLPEGDTLHKMTSKYGYNICKVDNTVRDSHGYMIKSKTQQALLHYGLIGKNSETKFIPQDYQYADTQSRWELLRGLLDTDGYTDGNDIEYTTVSPMLRDGMLELVRSLGGKANVKEKHGNYYRNQAGEKIFGKLVYRISIEFSNSAHPFYLPRKANKFSPKRKVFKKFIDRVEYVGKQECQCIMVDDPSQLYVTDDYIITHNTTIGIFFMSWMAGREPDKPSLASAYADKLTNSFYTGVLQLIKDDEYTYKEIFPNSPLVATNSKEETIDLKNMHRFKTLTCRSIDGGLTGATRCESLLYADDMVSGIEEAMNRDRMDTLWFKFTNDLMSRMKEGCRMLIIGTRWSVWDPLGRLEARYEDDKSSKFVRIPALDDNGNSNFNYSFGVGFSKKYFEDIHQNMDEISWGAIYQQHPIEREGVLYHEDGDFQWYNGELPKDHRPDAIVAVCDSKNQGKDYVASICGYIYGDSVYIHDLVFSNGLPDVTKPMVAMMCYKNHVSRLDVELNNGGEYYAEDVDKQIHKMGGTTSIRTFITSSNKITRIVTEADYVKKHFVFLERSKQDRVYKAFMRNVCGFTTNGKSKHDDAPDALSMLSLLVKHLTAYSVHMIDRSKIPL